MALSRVIAIPILLPVVGHKLTSPGRQRLWGSRHQRLRDSRHQRLWVSGHGQRNKCLWPERVLQWRLYICGLRFIGLWEGVQSGETSLLLLWA